MAEQERRRPTGREGWDERYISGVAPWDSGRSDLHLARVVEEHDVEPGAALEIGCGTGTNLIWLAQRGFEVTGLDLSPVAVERAQDKAARAGVEARLMAADFLEDEVPAGPYGFVYDRGCWHMFDDDDVRARFAARVAGLLAPGGIWHSLLGSTDGPQRTTGPPRRSAVQIVSALEPRFEILELRSTTFDRDHEIQARAWVMVARLREHHGA